VSSLYTRATPAQAVVLRMIEGAAKNAFHARPRATLGPQLARSIAKRATGTLTSQWGAVLAASAVTNGARSERQAGHRRPGVATPPDTYDPAVVRVQGASAGNGGGLILSGRPLVRLRWAVGAMAGEARRAGNAERLAALADVLRLIAGEEKGPASC